MPLKEVIPNIWRASEEDTLLALKEDKLNNFHTIVCLRRKLPIWWPLISHELKYGTNLLHFPIPPSLYPECAERIFEFLRNYLPIMRLPILIFCKKGRNRTGMVSALIKLNHSYSLNDSLKEYLDGVSSCIRENEILIIKRLSVKSKECM